MLPMNSAPSATYVNGPSASALVSTLYFVTYWSVFLRAWRTTAEIGRISPASMVRYWPATFCAESQAVWLSSMLAK